MACIHGINLMSSITPTSSQPMQAQPLPAGIGSRGQSVPPEPSSAGVSNQIVQRPVTELPRNQRATTEDLKNAAVTLQNHTSTVAPELLFSVGQASGRSIIKVTDPSTNTVSQQIPLEEALHVTKEIDQFLKHQELLINRKA